MLVARNDWNTLNQLRNYPFTDTSHMKGLSQGYVKDINILSAGQTWVTAINPTGTDISMTLSDVDGNQYEATISEEVSTIYLNNKKRGTIIVDPLEAPNTPISYRSNELVLIPSAVTAIKGRIGSINGLTGDVNLRLGAGARVNQSGNKVTIDFINEVETYWTTRCSEDTANPQVGGTHFVRGVGGATPDTIHNITVAPFPREGNIIRVDFDGSTITIRSVSPNV